MPAWQRDAEGSAVCHVGKSGQAGAADFAVLVRVALLVLADCACCGNVVGPIIPWLGLAIIRGLIGACRDAIVPNFLVWCDRVL